MSTPEALRLADWLEDQYDPTHNYDATAAELRRQHAEIERLNARCASAEKDIDDLIKLSEKLADERYALRKDAERYRWLRDHTLNPRLYEDNGFGGTSLLGFDELDEEIDAAMKGDKP